MEVEKSNSSSASPADSTSAPVDSSSQSNTAASRFSASNFSSWAKNFKFSQSSDENAESSDGKKSALGRIASGLGIRTAVNTPAGDKSPGEASPTAPTQDGAFGVITKGFLDTSKNAMRAVQLKARHMVSQNKRRYQEDGFDLDLTYITENIIAMGFPAGDSSSGILGYVEGFYRNHMEEVIRFFESHHKGKYKVYNLCSERLYDASLLEGKVASFPFDDHNCPPIQLIVSFCQSAYSWLKEDIENVVVVHCKAGMARTGLMISSLLLYLKFYPTAEESMEYYNQKRCVDGKGLVLPSQIRYVKYFERVLTYFNGEVQPGRRCILRGFRFHRCPYWVRPSITVFDHNGVLFSTKKHPRTKDMMPEDFWFSAPRKGIMVFALPGERGLAELNGDFKVLFHDRNGDFYCWLNTSMMENRQILNTSELDGFDKRKLPCPGFQVEVVLMDADVPAPSGAQEATVNANSGLSVPEVHPEKTEPDISDSSKIDNSTKDKESLENEDIFSDSEGEDNDNAHTQTVQKSAEAADASELSKESVAEKNNMANISTFVSTCQISSKDEDSKTDTTKVKDHMIDKKNTSSNVKVGEQLNSRNAELTHKEETKTPDRESESDFKPIGADASVFTFGDEEDYESD